MNGFNVNFQRLFWFEGRITYITFETVIDHMVFPHMGLFQIFFTKYWFILHFNLFSNEGQIYACCWIVEYIYHKKNLLTWFRFIFLSDFSISNLNRLENDANLSLYENTTRRKLNVWHICCHVCPCCYFRFRLVFDWTRGYATLWPQNHATSQVRHIAQCSITPREIKIEFLSYCNQVNF